ncbi:MAG: hypothetical protein KDA24_12230 [Deltaproteobacteria bacterium]|nr:hypothetical protein [Deltaproteobacteria bacterium]
MSRRLPLFTLALLLPALMAACGGSESVCLSDGVQYDELPEGAIFNGTCVSEGERFDDRYSCDMVEGPCRDEPHGTPSSQVTNPDPERLNDPDLDWAQAQAASCSCSCCHRDSGVSADIWSYDFEGGAWTDSMNTDRLRRLAEYPSHTGNVLSPEENFGFRRDETGMPTTDPDRLRAFLEREVMRRGD